MGVGTGWRKPRWKKLNGPNHGYTDVACTAGRYYARHCIRPSEGEEYFDDATQTWKVWSNNDPIQYRS